MDFLLWLLQVFLKGFSEKAFIHIYNNKILEQFRVQKRDGKKI